MTLLFINVLAERWPEAGEPEFVVGKSGSEWEARAEVEECLDSEGKWRSSDGRTYLHTLVLDSDGDWHDTIDLRVEVLSRRRMDRAADEAERQWRSDLDAGRPCGDPILRVLRARETAR